MAVKCFMLVPTNMIERSLRRYARDDAPGKNPHFHDASIFLDRIEGDQNDMSLREGFGENDPRWPKACACGYAFEPRDVYDVFVQLLWKREDTGEICTLRKAPPGSIYDAFWMHKYPAWCGPDGKSLFCVLPDGHVWHIDGRASNCTRKEDSVHRCWVRHGEPPMLTVDKNGNTCNAGAGSILTDKWHGFLRNGVLVES